ncbi:hypothetical protein AB7M29_003041 [Pseudomonas sp. F-14 TE3623]
MGIHLCGSRSVDAAKANSIFHMAKIKHLMSIEVSASTNKMILQHQNQY